MGGEGRIEDIEKIILVVSLVLFLVSSFSLAVLNSEPVSVSRIDPSMEGMRVKITGDLASERHVKGISLAYLDTNISRVKVVDLCGRPINGREFVGVVKVYKGKPELVLDGDC